jgi:hypothetical protein
MSPPVRIEASKKNSGMLYRQDSDNDEKQSSPELFSNSIGSYKEGEWSEAMRSSSELVRQKKTEKEKQKKEHALLFVASLQEIEKRKIVPEGPSDDLSFEMEL